MAPLDYKRIFLPIIFLLDFQAKKHTFKLTNMLRQMKLKNVRYTGRLMKRLSLRYRNDVAPFLHLSLAQFYNYVKKIPYTPDPKGNEYLQRPYHTLARNGGGGDCDDKSILLGAYLANYRIPFRFVAVGKSKTRPFHHVITEAYINKQWVHLDPTYTYNTFAEPLYNYQKRLVIS